MFHISRRTNGKEEVVKKKRPKISNQQEHEKSLCWLWLSTYISVPLGNNVPNSFIRSLILNRRRRSTEEKKPREREKNSFVRKDFFFSILILWLSFFWRSRATRRNSSSVNGIPIFALALRIFVGHDEERNTELFGSFAAEVDN